MTGQAEINDGIDLFNIIKSLIDNFTKITLIALAVFFLPALYILNSQAEYKAKIEFDLPSANTAFVFNTLNVLLKENDDDLDLITENTLYNEFVFEFLKYDLMAGEFYKNRDQWLDDEDLEKVDIELASIGMAKSFKVFQTDQNYRRDYIQFTTKDPEFYEQILNATLDGINEKIFNDIILRLAMKIETTELENSIKLKSLEERLKIRKRIYLSEVDRNLTFLNEQSEIASHVGIIEPWFIEAINTDVIINDDFPFYLRGAKAIKQEVELIKSRDLSNIEIYDADYSQLLNEYLFLSENIKTETLKSSLESLDNLLKKENLSVVGIDTSLIEYRVLTNKVSYLLITALISGFLSVVFVLGSIAYRKRLSIKPN